MPLPRLSLRVVLVVAFVVQTCVTVGTLAFISLRSSQQNTKELAGKIREQAILRLRQHLDEYLQSPHTVNQLTQSAIDRGFIDPQNLDQLRDFFLVQIRTFPVRYIGFSSLEDRFVGVDRPPDGSLQIDLRLRAGKLQVFNERFQKVKEIDYAPHREAWYLQGLTANQPIWSNIYQWNDRPDIQAIAASQPLYDRRRNLVGVIGTDLTLNQIDQYLQTIQITPNSRIFVVERSGLLVASSVAQPVGKERLALANSPDPLAQTASQLLRDRYPDLRTISDMYDQYNDTFIQVTSYRDQRGLDWLIVLVVPTRDLMGQVNENTRLTLTLWGIATAIALGIGWLIARWLAKPIQKLNEDTQHIALDPEFAYSTGQIDCSVESSWIVELSGLARSFRQMAIRLQEVVDKLHYQAYYDPLTGAGNQNLLRKRIQECLAQKQEFVLLYLDLDRFKSLQYAFGHQISETLLLEIALRIASCTTPKDTVARIGIDEFAVLFCDLGDRQLAALKAEELHQCIDAPFYINGSIISSTTSIGAVSSHLGGTTPETYLDAADTAIHYAKMWGKGKTVFYNAGMQTLVAERLQLESELKQAIAESQLHLNYQPIVDLRTGKVVSFEALVRWQHPRRGMMPPTKFISIAEETGLIIALGRWVMAVACEQIEKLHYNLPDYFPLSIGVNVSEVQLRYPRFLAEVDELIANLPRHTLKIELTETCLMESTDMIQSLLTALRERSISLLIDDFGTGYSSLSYLQRLPVDTLKIDRSFITGIENNPRHFDITRAIMTLAHSLGMDVVAEGVETKEQLAILQNLGCEYGQGYLFSKPLPQEEVIPFLQNYQPPI
ncbi:MAG: EAL domain-containing protein [Pseudanabaenaceae cyanobacterium]